MSKSKKSKKAADSESPAQVESHEVESSEEPAQPTIVESSAAQLFPNQENTQEVGEQTEEKPATKSKVSKRPYIADVEVLLNAGSHTKKEMLAAIMEKYPSVSKGGVSTFITDLRNIKYNHFKPRAVVKLADGKLQFADMVPAATEAPDNDLQPTDKPGEQPAE